HTYGVDMRHLDPMRDERVLKHWAGYINTFMRELRTALDPIRRPDRGKLSITATLSSKPENSRAGALEGETWVHEGWVDGLIIVTEGTPDYAYFMRLAKESGCRIYEGINPRRMPEKDYILRARRAYG